jgi:hypothetical protein
MLVRFVIYGLMGVCAEVAVSAILHKIAPLFEPLHDAIRAWPFLLRGTIYAGCFWLVEYAAGCTLRRALGQCPWSAAFSR